MELVLRISAQKLGTQWSENWSICFIWWFNFCPSESPLTSYYFVNFTLNQLWDIKKCLYFRQFYSIKSLPYEVNWSPLFFNPFLVIFRYNLFMKQQNCNFPTVLLWRNFIKMKYELGCHLQFSSYFRMWLWNFCVINGILIAFLDLSGMRKWTENELEMD